MALFASARKSGNLALWCDLSDTMVAIVSHNRMLPSTGPVEQSKKKKKMTQGWVVYGGMRHAEPQREMFPHSYTEQESLLRLDSPSRQCLLGWTHGPVV
jgi:hypothetical protein